jgi:tetratricopeptide (TPR) repeat protein
VVPASGRSAATGATYDRVGVTADRLRPLWDFTDLDGTEERLRAALAEERTDAGQAEVLTQLARVAGIRGRFESARELLAEAKARGGNSEVVRARVLREHGRVLRIEGDLAAAEPLFEEAFETALAAEHDFIAADAAHMAALAGDMRTWTDRGLELTRRSPTTARWAGSLLTNLGWWHAERGEFEESLVAYREALKAREREEHNGERPFLREAARCGVAKALVALGRPDEAVPVLEQAVEWGRQAGKPVRSFHEELAVAYAALGRSEDAAEQRRLSDLASDGPLAQRQAIPRPPPRGSQQPR